MMLLKGLAVVAAFYGVAVAHSAWDQGAHVLWIVPAALSVAATAFVLSPRRRP